MEWMLGAWVFCATERFCVLSSKQVSCPQSRVYPSLKRVDDVIDLKVCAMCFCVVFVQLSWLQRRWNEEMDGFVWCNLQGLYHTQILTNHTQILTNYYRPSMASVPNYFIS